MELPEKKLIDFIQDGEKAKWIPVNNHHVKNFTEEDITRITTNYSTPIGQGGFGQVYRGSLDDGTTVAVKKYTFQSLKDGFAKELIAHGQINHKNVVKLLGYCSEDDALMIVTEYVPRGNLKDLLHGSNAPISLDERLRIAIECADALGYMHSSMYQRMIHGDIKPDNILLDINLSAKLSDFGLSRLLSMDQTQHTMHVIGSRGYMDPEYIETGLVDPKSDVYSFGVVLLELITRAKASKNGFSTDLKRKFTDALVKGKQEAQKMFDTEIANEGNIEILDKIGNLAAQCFTKGIKERPEMKEVLGSLQMLRRSLECEQAQEKGQRSSSGTDTRTQMVDDHGSSIPSSSSVITVNYKFGILDIFRKKSRRNKLLMEQKNGGPILKAPSITLFTAEKLRKITDDYSRVIGNDFSGPIYKGNIEGQVVVVKQSMQMDETNDFNFVNAVTSAFKIRHMNIIRLLGCCLETKLPLLVYEFASSGSLHDYLHSYSLSSSLTLDLRLGIALGSAQALEYLHSTQILFGDFTSSKIMLDHDFLPKVLGIVSALQMTFGGQEFLPCCNMNCIDPFYMKTGRFTSKTDVYSFGIVLLELLTRKQPIYEKFSLGIEYIKACRDEISGKAMFDKEIAVERNMVILEEMDKLAVECLTEDADKRPQMAEVVERLQKLRRDLKHTEGGLQVTTASHAE